MEATLTPYGPGAIVLYKPKLRLSNDAYWRVGGISQHYVMVVTARRAFNDNSVLVMPITSQVDRYYGYRLWLRDKWAVIEPDRMHTLDMSLIDEYVGVVPKQLYDKCIRAFGWIVGMVDEIPECYASIPDVYAFATAGSVNIPKNPLKFGAKKYNSTEAVAWNCYHAMGLGPGDVPLPTVETVEAEGPLAPENYVPAVIELPAPEPQPAVQEVQRPEPKPMPAPIAGGKPKDEPIVIEVPQHSDADKVKLPLPAEVMNEIYATSLPDEMMRKLHEMNYPEPQHGMVCPKCKAAEEKAAEIEKMETVKGTTVEDYLSPASTEPPRRGKKAAKAKKAARAVAEAARKAQEEEEARQKVAEEKAAKQAALEAERARLVEEAKARKAAKDAEERLKQEADAKKPDLLNLNGLPVVAQKGVLQPPRIENVVRDAMKFSGNKMALETMMKSFNKMGVFDAYPVDHLKKDCYVESKVTRGEPTRWDDLRGDYRTRLSQLFSARMPKDGESWGYGNQLSSAELGNVMMGLIDGNTGEFTASDAQLESHRYIVSNAEHILEMLIDPNKRSKTAFRASGKRKSNRQPYELTILNTDNIGKLTPAELDNLEEMADKYNVRYAAIAELYYSMWTCQRVINKLDAMYTYRNESVYADALMNELMLGYEEALMVHVYAARVKPKLKTIRKWATEHISHSKAVDEHVSDVNIEKLFTIMCNDLGWDAKEFGDKRQMTGALLAAYGHTDIQIETWPTDDLFVFHHGSPYYWRYNHIYSIIGKKWRKNYEAFETVNFEQEYVDPPYLGETLMAFYNSLSNALRRDIYLGYQSVDTWFEKFAEESGISQERINVARLSVNGFMLKVVRFNILRSMNNTLKGKTAEEIIDLMIGIPNEEDDTIRSGLKEHLVSLYWPEDLMKMGISLKDYKAACEMRGITYATQTFCGIVEYNDIMHENEVDWFKA